MNIQLLASLGTIIIVALAAYALFMWKQVWKQEQESAERLKHQIQEEKLNTKKANEQIVIMARVVLEQQVSLTEAAIRIMAYTRALPNAEQNQSHFLPFDQLAKATAHIPILEQWKVLAPAKQEQFDIERHQLENIHQKAVMDACHQIVGTRINSAV